MMNKKYKILDETPKEGDYGINLKDPKCRPRLVIKAENGTLGMKLEPDSWFEWLPLRDDHRKVEFLE